MSEKFAAALKSAAQNFILFFMKLVIPSGPNSVQSPVFRRGTMKINRWRENMAQLFPPCPTFSGEVFGVFLGGFFFFSLFVN